MTAPYRKRAKGGWSGGKDQKESSNRSERAYEHSEIKEQLEENTNKVRKVVKKTYSDKEITTLLSGLRYVRKFANNHAGGDVEALRFPKEGDTDSWWTDVRNDYYQKYKTGIPKLQKLLEREDLPKKVQRQIKEVLALFNIETELK